MQLVKKTVQNPATCQGSISSKNLREAFTCKDTKSAKSQNYLFALLGSVGTEASRKTLVKLTPVPQHHFLHLHDH